MQEQCKEEIFSYMETCFGKEDEDSECNFTSNFQRIINAATLTEEGESTAIQPAGSLPRGRGSG